MKKITYILFFFFTCIAFSQTVNIKAIGNNACFFDIPTYLEVRRDYNNLTGALVVNYTVTGTGANKVNVVSGSTTLADGAYAKMVKINSLGTVVGEENFTITLTSGGYTIGTNSVANFRVRDSYDTKVFPTGFGGAAFITGGRGGQVIHVTNLNDSGAGSAREAIQVATGKRIVVFDVSGTIELQSPMYLYDGNITIAGQTAPAGGITFTTAFTTSGSTVNSFGPFRWSTNQYSSLHNIVIRYIRIRQASPYRSNGAGLEMALEFNNVSHIMLDHISTSWAVDKAVGISDTTFSTTMQNLLIGESNTGGIMGGGLNNSIENNSYDTSTLYNVFYDVSHRFPNPNGKGRSDVINNIGYNYRYRLINAAGGIQLNAINNWYSRGSQDPTAYGNGLKQKYTGNSINPTRDDTSLAKIYATGTFIEGYPITNEWDVWTAHDNWSYNGTTYTFNTPLVPSDFQAVNKFAPVGIEPPILNTTDLITALVPNVGASKRLSGDGTVYKNEDAVDTLYKSMMTNGTYSSYNYNEDWTSKQHYIDFRNTVSNVPINTRPAGYDTDNDGIPNEYETAKGWNPNVANNNVIDTATGYTQLELFLNEVDSGEATEAPVIPVVSVSVSPSTSSGAVGTGVQLQEVFNPENSTDKTGVWTTSNAAVATVDNLGLVVRQGEGTATITYTSNDGSHTGTSTITVTGTGTPPPTIDGGIGKRIFKKNVKKTVYQY